MVKSKINLKLSRLWLGWLVVATFAMVNFVNHAQSATNVFTLQYSGANIFNESNLAPGSEVVKNLTVTNNGTVNHSFAIATSNVSGDLAKVLEIEPRINGVAVWRETLDNLANLPTGSKTIIGSLGPNQSQTIAVAAILPSTVGNEYQGKTASNFNFVMGSQEAEPVPALAPAGPVPLVGANLFGQGGGVELAQNQPAPTEVAPAPATPGDEEIVKGDFVARPICYWWLVGLILLAVILSLLQRRANRKGPTNQQYLPILSAGIIFAGHWYIDRFYQTTIFCRYYWILIPLVLVIYYLIGRKSAQAKEKEPTE